MVKLKLRNAINFLMWSYFKLTLDDGGEVDKILGICIQRAYSDATQQGAYNTLIGKNETELRNHSKTAGENASKVLFDGIRTLKNWKENFDTWHEKTCEAIKDEYKEVNKDSERFSYGNAQKWVNMTLKYIYTLYWLYEDVSYEDVSPECKFCKEYGEIVKKYEKEFHVPIDSYMIEALELKKDPVWSKWSKADYLNFRKELEADKSLDWEGPKWIDVAQKRKKQ